MTRAKVIDASALAAVLFGEPRGGEVVAEVGTSKLLAATLIRYEIASVARAKLGDHGAQRSAIRAAVELFEHLSIDEVQMPCEGMLELAERHGLTAYDAAYLALSLATGCPLVTLDARLARAAGDARADAD